MSTDPRSNHAARAELVAQLGWVQRLALSLVRDPAVADDLAQDAARIALDRREPIHGSTSGLRGWLASVVRQLARNRARSEAARRTRELSVSRAEALEPLDVVERSARAQRVAEAVAELDEPYRSTVLHRYFDDLSMSEVARKTDVSEEAARKRLERGLAMLRTRLDREFGARSNAWALALLDPALRGSQSASAAGGAAAKGSSLVGAKWAALAGGVVVFGVVVWLRAPRTDGAVADSPTPPMAGAVAAGGESTRLLPPSEPTESARSSIETPPAQAPVSVPTVPPAGDPASRTSVVLHGSVFVDDEHRAPRGLKIVIEGSNLVVRVDETRATWRAELDEAKKSVWMERASLWVTSDGTVPTKLDVTPDDVARKVALDLRLRTGRTLELTFLDADSHAPLAHLPFVLARSVALERSVKMNVFKDDELRLVTDGMGRARARGIPIDGHVRVRLDARARHDSLWSTAVDERSPDVIEQTIYAKVPLGEAVASGVVPEWARASLPGARSVRVRALQIVASSARAGESRELSQDPSGRFELHAAAPSRHRVWLEDAESRQPLSDTTEVEFAAAGEQLPIEFRQFSQGDFALHLVNVPSSGFVALLIHSSSHGARTARTTCAGRPIDWAVPLRADESMQVRCALVDEDTHQAGYVVHLELDPSRAGEVTIDLGGTARVLSIEAPGVELRGDAWIALFPVDAGAASMAKTTRVPCSDGRASIPIVVPTGRWLYVYDDKRAAHAIYGVVDVSDAEDGAPLVLRPSLVMRPLAELGREVAFLEIDGVSLEKLPRRWSVRWKSAGDQVAMPKNARYDIVER